ncbi:hypothetical protein B484DRAFT_433660 [Ochromonadaceae sp. CCMP2298]|nr:hypothetical protein B484DRAFT_433660 [Ochromonadaceae sp. CCMP2298]|mmetsp:Transcript_32288/g.71103  ORF Transcript_32288/g.71103 Transcript_32288/m.71103 type:complete len:308 (+) Transcript_32288:3-926(+)
MMIARLVLLLVALAVASAGESLRKEADNVPLDNVRGMQVFQRNQKKASTRNTNNSLLDKYTDHDAIKAARAAHGRQLQVSKKYNWDDVVKSGSVIQRLRPNADCSGVIVEVEVAAFRCVKYDNDLDPNNHYAVQYGMYMGKVASAAFDAMDCSGQPFHTWQLESYPKCEMDSDEYGYMGPMSSAIEFSTKSVKQLMSKENPGFLLTWHVAADCSDDIVGYHNFRADACQLDMNVSKKGEPKSYSYVKYTQCKGNKASMTVYSDAACSRPMYRSQISLRSQTKCNLADDDADDDDDGDEIFAYGECKM